jgi:hypothetical protein
MTRFPKITTLKQFCKATGYPEKELGKMYYTEVSEILALFDLQMGFKINGRTYYV